MQAKETGDVVGLIHRIRKKYYHYKVSEMKTFTTMNPETYSQIIF